MKTAVNPATKPDTKPATNPASDPAGDPSSVQGEGDYKSAQRYQESLQSFVKAGKVPDAAKKAKPATSLEELEMKHSEDIGLSHSKGEDPGVKRQARGKA